MADKGLLGNHRLEISRVIREAGGKLTAAGIIGSSQKLKRRFTTKQIYGLIHKLQLNDIAANLQPQFVMHVEESDPTIYYVDTGMVQMKPCDKCGAYDQLFIDEIDHWWSSMCSRCYTSYMDDKYEFDDDGYWITPDHPEYKGCQYELARNRTWRRDI